MVKKSATELHKKRLRNAKQKLETARNIMNQNINTPSSSKARRTLTKSNTYISSKKRNPSKLQCRKKLEKANAEILRLNKELTESQEKIARLNKELATMKFQNKLLVNNNRKIRCDNMSITSKQFTFSNIKNTSNFQYLCGLRLMPYFHLIPYPDCCHTPSLNRSLDKATELLAVLTICRHGVHQGLMAFFMDISKSTMQRIFIGWVIFVAGIFNEIDLKPPSGFLLKKMPKSFIETGHGLTDLVIDATEFKFQRASNYELNSLMFSNYKNTQTGKALIGISPHGSGILFSDIYPGSISDSDITEKTDAIRFVEEEHEIMSDRGFSIQEHCALKGITLNRPKHKNCDQFSEKDVSSNFDIAAYKNPCGTFYWQSSRLVNIEYSLAYE